MWHLSRQSCYSKCLDHIAWQTLHYSPRLGAMCVRSMFVNKILKKIFFACRMATCWFDGKSFPNGIPSSHFHNRNVFLLRRLLIAASFLMSQLAIAVWKYLFSRNLKDSTRDNLQHEKTENVKLIKWALSKSFFFFFSSLEDSHASRDTLATKERPIFHHKNKLFTHPP